MTNTSDNNDTVISDTEIRLLISSEETNRDDNSHDNETATPTTNFTGKKLRALVAAAFTIVLLISLSIYHRYDNGLSCKPGQQFGKRGDESDYACPDSTGATIDSITLLWGGVSVKFSKHKVIRWNTPTADIVNFVSKDLKGPVLSVLHTTGKCEKGSERPGENFYMCGPLNGIAGTACGLSSPTCGRHSHADYSNTGWDKGHMITSHEGGPFADGEQQTFSMCNIWPQGKQFNERWWQHLEFTCDGYAIDKETLILSGPIFANGTNDCMGEFDDSHGSATQLTTGPIVLCDSVRPEGAPESPIPIPSNFFQDFGGFEEENILGIPSYKRCWASGRGAASARNVVHIDHCEKYERIDGGSGFERVRGTERCLMF